MKQKIKFLAMALAAELVDPAWTEDPRPDMNEPGPYMALVRCRAAMDDARRGLAALTANPPDLETAARELTHALWVENLEPVWPGAWSPFKNAAVALLGMSKASSTEARVEARVDFLAAQTSICLQADLKKTVPMAGCSGQGNKVSSPGGKSSQ